MHIVAIAWMFVVVLMTAAEATSPQGTLLGAFFTFLLYGLLPLGIVLYVLGTPARRRARQRTAAEESADAGPPEAPSSIGNAALARGAQNADPSASIHQRDGARQPSRDRLPPE